MNWLEIGCPYCPTVLTVPRSASGRSVRCPECGKSYFVPDATQAIVAREAAAPSPPRPESAEAVAAPASKGVERVAVPTAASSSSAPSPPRTIPAVVAAAKKAAASPPSPSQGDPYAALDPELASESPLPELEILAPPPRRPAAPLHQAATRAAPPTVPRKPMARESVSSLDEPPSKTVVASRPPIGPETAAAPPDGATDEVKSRMSRERRRALINLIVFGVGILVMTIFAIVVIQISRRT